MHDTPDQVHWHEPKAGENAGYGKFKRAPMPYDRFMEAEGVPVYRGIGVRRVQDLPLAPWKRLGGRGSYIQLFGTEGLWGLYLVEIPSASALNVERHLYEKVVLVVEGRGTTEVWQEGQGKRHAFEWQKGSLFSIPLNAYHRLVNTAQRPPPPRECGERARAALVRDLGAERHERDRQHRFRLQLSLYVQRALRRGGGLLQAPG